MRAAAYIGCRKILTEERVTKYVYKKHDYRFGATNTYVIKNSEKKLCWLSVQDKLVPVTTA